MKRVIICEKPDLAKKVIHWINEKFEGKRYKNSEYANYYESPNYYVTYVRGHIFEAYDIEDYTKSDEDWNMDILPFYPENNHFYFKLRQTKNKEGKKVTDPFCKLQYETIYYLINHESTSGIIHFGDAGREGEIIIRQIVINANKTNKPMVRLWLDAMAPEAFKLAFANMKPDSEYDSLANEGMARLKMDYLYGINLTRYLSLKAKMPKGHPLRIGRVLGEMVNAIYQRELEIEHFVPEKYYVVISEEETEGHIIKLRHEKHYSDNDYMGATEFCARLNNETATVSDIINETKEVGPGKLFSLTSLQNKLSSKFKMSMNESLTVIQSVYEKGYITYPRTNTEYLPEGEKSVAMQLVDFFNKRGYDLSFRDSKMIFDSKKVEDHGAICPTTKIPADDLSANEMKVYETVRNRFLAVFCREKCMVNKSKMIINCGTEIFQISGSILESKGFLKYDEKEMKDTLLPPLKIGDKINILFSPVEEQTKPPSRYSVTTFNNYLESPFSDEKENDEEKYEQLMKGLEIGTVASRTSIISNMINVGYVSEKNQIYYLEPVGRYLMQIMSMLGIYMNKEKTVEMSVLLKKVKNNEMSENDVIENTKKDINEMFKNRNIEVPSCTEMGIISDSGYRGTPLGECVLCGGNVYETAKGFICENNKRESDECNFYFGKDDKYFNKVTGKKITAANISSLLKNGYIVVKTKSQKGIPYETMMRLKMNQENRLGWEVFTAIGKCPICGGVVSANPYGYFCEAANTEKCFFKIFRNDKFIEAFTHKEVSLRQAATILNKGAFIVSIEKKDKSGKYKMKFILVKDLINRKLSWDKEFVKNSYK